MTGSIFKIGNEVKKIKPDCKVSYMPGLPGTFVAMSKSGDTKKTHCYSIGAYCKAEEVAKEITA